MEERRAVITGRDQRVCHPVGIHLVLDLGPGRPGPGARIEWIQQHVAALGVVVVAGEGALAVVDDGRIAARTDGIEQAQDRLGLAGAGAADEGQVLALAARRQRHLADAQAGGLALPAHLAGQLVVADLDRPAQVLAGQHAPAEALDRPVHDDAERHRQHGGEHADSTTNCGQRRWRYPGTRARR